MLGLVENIENAAKARADLRGEADALGFAAGKRGGGAIQTEIAEADGEEEIDALETSFEGTGSDFFLALGELHENLSTAGRAALSESAVKSAMDKPRDLTASDSGRRRLPWHAASVADMYCVIHSPISPRSRSAPHRPAVDKILVQLTERQKKSLPVPSKEVSERIDFLLAVGLGYLSLDRSAATLFRRRSPAHPPRQRKSARAFAAFSMFSTSPASASTPATTRAFSARSNSFATSATPFSSSSTTKTTIRRADFVVDLGPGAGNAGGYLVAQGKPAQIEANSRIPHRSIPQRRAKIAVPEKRRSPNGKAIQILGASANNLKDVDITLPLGLLTVVTGVSGSGKSTLVNDILYRALAQKTLSLLRSAAAHREIIGSEHIDKVIEIDQAPIGRTPRSNPATYTGVFAPIRDLFAMLPESRERGYRPGRFSFNVKGGRCEACQGDGLRRIEMNFLPDVYVMCEVAAAAATIPKRSPSATRTNPSATF